MNNKQGRSALFTMGSNGIMSKVDYPDNIAPPVPTEERDLSVMSEDMEAENIITYINKNMYSVGMLTERQKHILYRYFLNYNPILNRVLSLFTKIITSSITVQKPKDSDNDIIQDYIHSFYTKMIRHVDLNKVMKNILSDFWIYKSAYIMVENDYLEESDADIEMDEELLLEKVSDISLETKKKIDEITERYKKNPLSTTKEERDFVLSESLLEINKQYRGHKRIKVISPLEIEKIEVNDDIDVKFFHIRKSRHVDEYLSSYRGNSEENIEKYDELIEMGYTSGYLKKYKDSSSEYIELSNDPLDEDGCFMIEFTSDNNGVNMDSILIDLITYYNILIKQKDKTLTMNKGIKILSAPMATMDEFSLLTSQIVTGTYMQEGIPMVCVNYEVSIEDVSFDTRSQFEEDSEEDVTKRLIIGLGIPDSLVTASDSYGGSFLKLETMETEFSTIRDDLTGFVENKLFVPLSLQKGFITTDIWGGLVAVKPKLDFKAGAIVNKSDFKETLQTLVENKKLPDKYLVEYLGYDNDTVNRDLSQQQEDKNSLTEPEEY